MELNELFDVKEKYNKLNKELDILKTYILTCISDYFELEKIDKKDKIYFISKNFQSDIYPGFKFKQKKDFRQNQNIIKKVRKYDIINSEKNKFFTFYETIEFNNYIVYTRCMSEKYHAIEMCEKFCVYPKNYNLKNYMDKNHEDYLFKATKNI